MVSVNEALQESCNIVAQLKAMLFGPDGYNNLWVPVGGANQTGNQQALLYYFQSPYFNKLQRWSARFLYKTNGYAISAVSNLVGMIIGEGFQYVCDSDSMQRDLDDWMDRQKWQWRERQSLEKLIVDGEVFIRLFDDSDHPNLRWIDPEVVYSASGLGVETEPDDYETVLSYTVNNKCISADEVQHRKLAWAEEKRGTSVLFPIAQSLINAESLLQSLVRTADQLSRFAVVRKHDATKEQVQEYVGDIKAQQRQQFPYQNNQFGWRNIEEYPAGTIVDTGPNTDWVFPGASIDGDKYVEVLRAVLRLCAARVGLPENVLSQDQDSIAAYNGQLVANSHTVKGLEAWQKRICDWNLELLGKCGFDTKKISIVEPEIAMFDKSEHVMTGDFLLRNKLASKQTVAKGFEIDYDEEQKIMATEPQEELQVDTLDNSKSNNSEDQTNVEASET